MSNKDSGRVVVNSRLRPKNDDDDNNDDDDGNANDDDNDDDMPLFG